ncbi:hypothetical protein REPUB_Repub06bG0137600 [Reevesia pubescens]
MAKLSRNIVIVLFSVLLVALMMSEAVGKEICHDVLAAPGEGKCDPQSCKNQCTSKYGGSGLCVQAFENLYSFVDREDDSGYDHYSHEVFGIELKSLEDLAVFEVAMEFHSIVEVFKFCVKCKEAPLQLLPILFLHSY